jgi:integrase
MPRLTKSVPKYRRHKASGRAVVTLRGKDYYLGAYGSDESKAKYERLIAEYLVNKRLPPPSKPAGTPDVAAAGRNLTIQEVFLRYWKQHVVTYYVKRGKPTSEQNAIRLAMKLLIGVNGLTLASDFGPSALKAYRQALIDKRLCRRRINQDVGRVKRMFKWACENELVLPTVYHGLVCVGGLRYGRSEAPETDPVKPVPDELVDATLKHVPPAIGAMIQLQRLTGMRPGEVTIMRACDIDTSGPLWIYTPQSHKTEHHGRNRQIFLGPQAQEIVARFWKPDLQAYGNLDYAAFAIRSLRPLQP